MVRLISLSVYYLQTFQVVSINYVQLLICQSYLNKVVKKKNLEPLGQNWRDEVGFTLVV